MQPEINQSAPLNSRPEVGLGGVNGVPPAGYEAAPPSPYIVGPESVPSLPPVEAAPIRGQEAYEQRADMAGVGLQHVPVATSQQAATQAPVAMPSAQQPVQSSSTAAPLVAADDDLIEKEWVDKAKDIIKNTADDPFARTAQVNDLQRSYVQKRYGKVLGGDS